MRVLVVEDDLVGYAVQVGLKEAGYAVDWVKDGVSADHALANESYVLVVLDIGLPRMSGLDVLKRLRQRDAVMPVIILTAMDMVEDRIRGLDAGADDYLPKPFDMGELIARVRSLIRRAGRSPAPLLRTAGVVLEPAAHQVTYNQQEVDLTAKEFSVLHVLMRNAGKVLSRSQIEQQLYAWGEEVASNAVEVHIHHLRRKLFPEIIETVRGVGYLIAGSDHQKAGGRS